MPPFNLDLSHNLSGRATYRHYELVLGANLVTTFDVLMAVKSIEGLGSPATEDKLSELVEKVILPAVAQAELTFAAVADASHLSIEPTTTELELTFVHVRRISIMLASPASLMRPVPDAADHD